MAACVGCVNCSANETLPPAGKVLLVTLAYGLPAGGSNASVLAVALNSVALLLRLSSTSETGAAIVLSDVLVSVIVCA